MTQGAGSPFKPPLEPADDLPLLQAVDDMGEQFFFIVESAVGDIFFFQERVDRVGSMFLSPVGVLHDKLSGLTQHHVIGVESSPNGAAAVAGRGLDVNLFKWRLAQDFSVGNTIQGDATGHAQPFQARGLVGVLRHVQDCFLDHRLNARRHIRIILILARQFRIVARLLAEIDRIAARRREKVRLRIARWAKQLDKL